MAASEEYNGVDLNQQNEDEENRKKDEKKKDHKCHHYHLDYFDYMIMQDVADTVHETITRDNDPDIEDSSTFHHAIPIFNNDQDSDHLKNIAAASAVPAAVITDHNVYDQGHNLDTPGFNSPPDYGVDHGGDGCCDGDDGCCDCGGGDDHGDNDCCCCDGGGDGDGNGCDCDDCVIL